MQQAKIFVSYSHKDEVEKDALLTHLGVLQNENLIATWVDDLIGPGEDWLTKIETAIKQSQVAIFLVTANFLNSKFILNKEMPDLLTRQQNEKLVVYPIIAKPCAWDKVLWLAKMNVRPKNGYPVWREGGIHADYELANIAREIADIATHMSKENFERARMPEARQIPSVPTGMRSYLEKQSKIHFENEIVDQNIIPIFVRELDLAGIRNQPHNSTTFSNFTNDLLYLNRKNAVILGEAGIGKTTELLKLTNSLAQNALEASDDVIIPIYVELRYFLSEIESADNVKQHILDVLRIGDEKDRRSFLDVLKLEKRFIIIFDGLNEIRAEHHSESIRSIIAFIKLYSNLQYIFSTRHYGFDTQLLDISWVPFAFYEVQRWDDEQIRTFFVSNNALDLYNGTNSKLLNLCRIPFVAHLLLNVLKSSQLSPNIKHPRNKGELYKSYVSYIFTRRDARINKYDETIKNDLLAEIAYFLNCQETLSLKYKYIKDLIDAQRLDEYGTKIIEEIIQNGILRQGGIHFLQELGLETPLEFMHQSFQEYFTASYITKKPESEIFNYLPIEKLKDAFWRDIPIYLAGLIERPLQFINALLQIDSNKNLLVASQSLVSCNCDVKSFDEMVFQIVNNFLVVSIQQEHYTKDAVEIIQTLGESASNLLLAHLDEVHEIIEVTALSGNEEIERKWRKYGRIIFILGELNSFELISKLGRVYKEVKDIHLLYHIVTALYSLEYDASDDLLQDEYVRSHSDPVVRTFSLLSQFKINPQDSQLILKKKELVPALTQNISDFDEASFALRAHSAEALGLLGVREAIEPLVDLLKNEKRDEPQSSAIKALGYIVDMNQKSELETTVIPILIGTLESGNLDNNEGGGKLLEELLITICTKDHIQIVRASMERISNSQTNNWRKQYRIEILQEIIEKVKTGLEKNVS